MDGQAGWQAVHRQEEAVMSHQLTLLEREREREGIRARMRRTLVQ